MCGQTMSEMERECVLAFDEMYSNSSYEYDGAKDRVLGPYNRMQMIMARSLCGSWKQMIFADFNVDMTKDIISEAITLLHQKGFNVAAIVSDCGGPNRGLLNSLSVNIIDTSFPHPITHLPIYAFADVPHLIKLFRNWLLKPTGITLKNGQTISKQPLKRLFDVTRTEINSMFK